jgi:hypothetical protein
MSARAFEPNIRKNPATIRIRTAVILAPPSLVFVN